MQDNQEIILNSRHGWLGWWPRTGIKAIFNEQVDEWRSRLLVNLIGRMNEIEIDSQMITKA